MRNRCMASFLATCATILFVTVAGWTQPCPPEPLPSHSVRLSLADSLSEAINNNDSITVVNLLDQGLNPNTPSCFTGRTIDYDERSRDFEYNQPSWWNKVWNMIKWSFYWIRYLVWECLHPEEAAASSHLPLHKALLFNRYWFAELLLEFGADPNMEEKSGLTPLLLAVQQESLPMVELLLYWKANPNNPYSGNDQNWAPARIKYKNGDVPLIMAFKLGDTKMARALIESGADAFVGRGDLASPIAVACLKDDVDLLKLLFTKGYRLAMTDKRGATPLHYAAQYCALNVVQYLLEQGVPVDPVDNEGFTPIFYTAGPPNARTGDSDQKPATAAILVAHGADINHIAIPSGSTLFHWALFRGAPKMAEWLLDNGYNVNQRDESGRTILRHLIDDQSRNSDVLLMLLKHGADVHDTKPDGQTPLCAFTSKLFADDLSGKIDAGYVKLLCEYGSDVNFQYKEPYGSKFHLRTPISNALNRQASDAVKILIEAGARLDSPTQHP